MKIYSTPMFLASIMLAIPPAAIAQSVERPYKFADFTEPFEDANGSTIRAFAKAENVSFDEAKRRLVAINRLNALSHTLQSRYPDAFAGLSIRSGATIEASLISVDGVNTELERDANALRYSIPDNVHLTYKAARKSLKQLDAEASSLVAQLKEQGIDAIVASDTITSKQRVMANDPNRVIQQLVNGKVRLSAGMGIEYSGGVTLTATEVAGGTKVENNNLYDNPSSCTLGFNVGLISGSVFGQSTAAHCVNDARNSYYNKRLGFQQEWASGGVDTQWHTFLGGPGYLVVGKMFPNSTMAMNVTGAQAVSPGSYVCKFGLTTSVTCGYVDTITVTDSYGTFPRILTNSTYPIQSLEGDSGGPVYSGTLAVGMTHARMKNPPYHNVFTPVSAWYTRKLPIGIIVCC